jgi:hypothetical protein
MSKTVDRTFLQSGCSTRNMAESQLSLLLITDTLPLFDRLLGTGPTFTGPGNPGCSP